MNLLRSSDIAAIADAVAERLRADLDDILTADTLAAKLGKTPEAVRKMCRRGQLPHHKRHGTYYFSMRELRSALFDDNPSAT